MLWTLWLALSLAAEPSPRGQQVLAAAEAHLGTTYVFGGRLGRPGCRRDGARVACQQGLDCLSLIFFAVEEVVGTRWWSLSVKPTELAPQLGTPVPGLDGVLRAKVDPALLAPGDVLFFLLEDYNLAADGPLHTEAGTRYGTWHTALVHETDGGVRVLHAAPGKAVRVDPLSSIAFDALYVVRM